MLSLFTSVDHSIIGKGSLAGPSWYFQYGLFGHTMAQHCTYSVLLCVFQMLTFLFLNRVLCCDHSLESSRQDDFNELSQNRIWLRFKDILQKIINVCIAICRSDDIWSVLVVPIWFICHRMGHHPVSFCMTENL